MRALVGLLLLSIALSALSSASRAQELGRCEPTKAVKIIDGALGEGKTLQQAMEMMIKAKVFDGSKACITFIRETSMTMRDAHPSAFKSLWMNSEAGRHQANTRDKWTRPGIKCTNIRGIKLKFKFKFIKDTEHIEC